MAWMEVTEDLTEAGIEKLAVGDILRFDQGGDLYELKIMRKNKGRIWAKPVVTYDPNDVEIVDK